MGTRAYAKAVVGVMIVAGAFMGRAQTNAQQVANAPSILLTAQKHLWLPLNKAGTGFFGQPGWATPVVEVEYEKRGYTGTNAVEIIELKVREDSGKEVKCSFLPEVNISATKGKIRVWFEDWGFFGHSTYSGAGELNVYLKANTNTTERISNTIVIPLAVDAEKQKKLETSLGPAPKSIVK